ncbi:MAG: nucleotidyl transferase AbiEii/AbiGii toxin family protein [Bifidobacteriaceae bacterium]|jgi:hypothetical protein|nr:nucleotidyl transferase AbiEii/AbiGii toxin family protein [Bifidobacteriaceae bacterium]
MRTGEPWNLVEALSGLTPKEKDPRSARILNAWITQAEDKLSSSGGRLGWLVASSMVTASLQRAVDDAGQARFLLKGGTMLQYRLPGMTRTTTDVDGLVRGGIESFLDGLDEVFAWPWGPLTLVRGEVEAIESPDKIVKPRRFDVIVELGGTTWRRVQVEVSPDEGHAGQTFAEVTPPSLAGFGLPSPERLVCLSLPYQVAQKIHAASGAHDPPEYVNDRARDVVDLLLIRDLARAVGEPDLATIRAAVLDTFETRAREATELGRRATLWPAKVIPHRPWRDGYTKAAASTGMTLSLGEAVTLVNAWLDEIDQA